MNQKSLDALCELGKTNQKMKVLLANIIKDAEKTLFLASDCKPTDVEKYSFNEKLTMLCILEDYLEKAIEVSRDMEKETMEVTE